MSDETRVRTYQRLAEQMRHEELGVISLIELYFPHFRDEGLYSKESPLSTSESARKFAKALKRWFDIYSQGPPPGQDPSAERDLRKKWQTAEENMQLRLSDEVISNLIEGIIQH